MDISAYKKGKMTRRQLFSKNICLLKPSRNITNYKATMSDTFMNKVVLNCDMLAVLMMNWICCEVCGTDIVTQHLRLNQE